MGVLDQLLEYKKYKDAQSNADLQAIPQAAMLYQQGKQQQLENTIKTLTLQGTLAKSGIGIGQNNQLLPDDRFLTAQNKGVYTVDAKGNLVQAGTVPGKSVVKQLPLTTEEIGKRAQVTADVQLNKQRQSPTAEMKNLRTQSLSALDTISRLEELAKKLPGGYEGIVSIGEGKITRGKSNPELAQYLRESKAAAASLYRAMTGDNRLSDEDAASRAYPLLWNPTDDVSTRDLAFERLRNATNQNLSIYDSAITGKPQEKSKEKNKSVGKFKIVAVQNG